VMSWSRRTRTTRSGNSCTSATPATSSADPIGPTHGRSAWASAAGDAGKTSEPGCGDAFRRRGDRGGRDRSVLRRRSDRGESADRRIVVHGSGQPRIGVTGPASNRVFGPIGMEQFWNKGAQRAATVRVAISLENGLDQRETVATATGCRLARMVRRGLRFESGRGLRSTSSSRSIRGSFGSLLHAPGEDVGKVRADGAASPLCAQVTRDVTYS
jgi:hypothetical protein